MTKIIGLIPARYASSRFPGKPLADINGKTMIQRVYEQASKTASLSAVIVATDDDRIRQVVENFGGKVCMTSADHPSGTDRCYEVVRKLSLDCDAIINIQGDEPFIDPGQINLLASCFNDPRTELATLIKKIESPEILFSPNAPKVIVDHDHFAVYFSRHPIPYLRGFREEDWLSKYSYHHHIGIYGYKLDALKKITALKPSSLEIAESLEQLRWIENGFRIKTAVTTFESIAVDTPQDLQRILNR